MSASEACWRIFRYSMHQEFPNVIRLSVHLPDHQIIYFQKGQNLQELEYKKTHTTLTAWFNINKTDAEAKNILYPDFSNIIQGGPKIRQHFVF